VSKIHIGTVCGHRETIRELNDAYCVELADCLCDICEVCYSRLQEVKNEGNPYGNGSRTAYWFNGNLVELVNLINLVVEPQFQGGNDILTECCGNCEHVRMKDINVSDNSNIFGVQVGCQRGVDLIGTPEDFRVEDLFTQCCRNWKRK
jgi:hypothetical protein